MITKKSILAGAALSCLLFLATTTPISADRAGASIDWDDSEDEAALTPPLPLISLEKKKKFTPNPDSKKNKSYRSVVHTTFVRSFLLAAVFWAVKFVLPQIIRYWIEHRQVVSSRGRGRKNGKSRGHHYDEEDLSTVVSTDQSISPSVMELIEMGNDFGDDGASFITAGTMGTTGTFATYLSSLVSKYRSRGRADKNPLARFNPPSASSKSKSSSAAAANSNQPHHDKHHQSTKHHHKSKQLDLSKISKRHSFKGLHFIDEDNANNNNNNSDDIIKGNHSSSRQQHKGSKERISNNLDDASQLPSMGGILKKDHRYSNSQQKNNDPSSPVERKLSAGASQDSDHNHKRGKEKHHHRNQHHHHHNEGRHHHRDGMK